MAILLNNHGQDDSEWAACFAELLPDLAVHQYPQIPDPSAIKYAVVWNHPAGDLATYPQLRAILNLGAGTDWLEADAQLPKVPVVRLLDPAVGVDMANYVLYWVLHFHRGFARYQRQQRQLAWQRFQAAPASQTRVTVLGLGLIGTFIAERISHSGYLAQAWNRSAKQLDGIDTYFDRDGLHTVLSKTDVLVNCLPHTSETDKLLNEQTLARMPQGAHLINVSRGGVIDHQALMRLLDSNHLAAAALDTFDREPLTENSPLWKHPKINVTPHMSGATYPNTSAKVVADNILRIESGERPFPIYPQYDV